MLPTLKIFVCILTVYRVSKAEPIWGWTKPAQNNEFPFFVSIGRNFDVPANNRYGNTCGGALITKRHILTSANCFSEDKSPSDYFVYVGSNDLAQSQKYEIESWKTHESWLDTQARCDGYRFFDNDIAVVKLREKVKSPAQPAKILSVSPSDLEGQSVKTVGWGFLSNDTTPRHLLKADLRVISRGECMTKVWAISNGSDPANYEHNIFCTNGANLFAVLDEADRGSPVFVDRGNRDYRIVGVNLKSVPSVDNAVQTFDQQNKHVGVHHYLRFIKSVTKMRYLPGT